MLTEQKYKDMSVKEFTKAAEIYDSGHAGLYEMCKAAGLKVKKLEMQKGFRMHLVAQK